MTESPNEQPGERPNAAPGILIGLVVLVLIFGAVFFGMVQIGKTESKQKVITACLIEVASDARVDPATITYETVVPMGASTYRMGGTVGTQSRAFQCTVTWLVGSPNPTRTTDYAISIEYP